MMLGEMNNVNNKSDSLSGICQVASAQMLIQSLPPHSRPQVPQDVDEGYQDTYDQVIRTTGR